jgi:hypothetical protein
MERFYEECLDRFSALHEGIKKAIDVLDGDALDWVPAGETNSINILVVHLTAAEKFWAAEIALGKTSDRRRLDEFEVKGLTKADLFTRLDETLEDLKSAFWQLKLFDLDKVRHSAQHNLDVTTAWAILHALEHTAIHVGHIQLTAQLYSEKE